MRRTGRFAACAVAVVVTLVVAARSGGAVPLTFGVSGANDSSANAPVESVTFDMSGTSLTVTLMDTPAAGVQTGSGALPAVFSSGVRPLPGVVDAEPAYEGSHEAATCDAIAGWAWNPQQPETPIAVNIYADESLLVTLTANQLRPDLLDAHLGNGQHAFTSPLPAWLKDGKPHQIRVIVAGSDFDLANTPKVISCAPAPNSK